MIKAFLFDYGGVMSAGGTGTEVPTKLSENLNIPFETANKLVWPAWSKLSRGIFSEDDFWADIEGRYGQKIDEKQRDVWNKWPFMAQIPEMTKLVADLKSNDYKVGLVSNTILATAEDIRKHGGYDIFNYVVLSYEVGFAKPEKEIYDIALNYLPDILPEEIVFVDDQERCLLPAREIGMKTVHVISPAQAITEIKGLLK